MTELVHHLRPAAGEPRGALVLLHGRGADEHDLAPFLDLLDPHRRLVGLAPGGPLFLPPGGRHWYIVPRVGFPEHDTFHASYELLQRDVPQLTGVPWERTILGGFSQGTVMAYALGLGAGRPTPAGIVAMSGFIPTVEDWDADLDRPGLPAWIAHGRRDPVIGIEFARAARDALAAAPVDLSYHEHDGAHHVDPRVLAELPAWVDRAVDAAAATAS
jgi:phospholipase/carboxylesterase